MSETQETVGRWIEETFPGGNPQSPRKALRALEEMVELCLAAGAWPDDVLQTALRAVSRETGGDENRRVSNPDKVPAEAADVLIVLYGLARLRGFNLHEWVDRKMRVNRARRWVANGDGTGYHVKEYAGE